MATTVGNLAVILSANTSRYSKGMRRAGRVTESFGRNVKNSLGGVFSMVTKLGVLATGGGILVGFTRQLSRLDSVAKTAAKIGETTEELSRLQFAGEQTGVAVNTMNMAMQRMVRRVSEAAKGSGEAKDAIKELGLDAQKLNKMKPAAVMRELADAMKKVKSPADRVRLAMRLFDSEGVSLVNTLAGGSEALDKFAQMSDKVGNTVSGKAAAQAEKFNDAINRLKATLGGGFATTIGELAPSITKLVDRLVFGWSQVRSNVIDNIKSSVNFLRPIVSQYMNTVMAAFNLLRRGASQMASAVSAAFKKASGAIGLSSAKTLSIQTEIVTALAVMEFGYKRFGDIVKLTMLKGVLAVVGFANRVKYFFVEVIGGVLKWVGENWRKIINDIAMLTATVFMNIGKNIVDFFKSVPDLISGEKSFKDIWTPLTEGFKAELSTFPSIAKREIGGLEKDLADSIGVVQKGMAGDFARHIGMRLDEMSSGAKSAAKEVASAASDMLNGMPDIAAAAEAGRRRAQSGRVNFSGLGSASSAGRQPELTRIEKQQLEEAKKGNTVQQEVLEAIKTLSPQQAIRLVRF